MWLTNKITCCLHLVVAIKALMTSADGLLMWCLKAYQRFHNKIAPRVPLWQHCQPHCLSFFGPLCCLLYSVVSTSGTCYIEIFIIKTVATDTAIKVTLHWFGFKGWFSRSIKERNRKQANMGEKKLCVYRNTIQILQYKHIANVFEWTYNIVVGKYPICTPSNF